MTSLLGDYVPGDSWLHALGVGKKYLLVQVLLWPALLGQHLWVTLGILAATVLGLLSARVPARWSVRIPGALVVVAAVLLGYQALLGAPVVGVIVAGNLLVAVYASRILTMTTPQAVLLDAFIRASRPLGRWINPEQLGLTVALMVRSIPVLLDSLTRVREAAHARGLQRSILAQLGPIVVYAVAFAQATEEALYARGLPSEGHPSPSMTA